ncbi:hypothetical protein, partial [Eisenbergiella tayi]|uniref:hypothetical protein n=1 Tax=Eisenbergiella tayi TaxID=1432052 RepID=UPI002432A4BF
AASSAALVPLRDYPSESVPCREPCSSAACAGDKGPEGSREGETGQRGRTPGTRTAALTFFSSPPPEPKFDISYHECYT